MILPAGPDHGITIGKRRCQRFFNQAMCPGICRFNNSFSMIWVGRAYYNRFNSAFTDHGFNIIKCLNPVFCCKKSGFFQRPAVNSRQFTIFSLLQGGCMKMGYFPASDDGSFNFSVIHAFRVLRLLS
jgi:hypothetical protein